MLIVDGGRRCGLRLRHCWFPPTAAEALATLATAPLVDVMQCRAAVAEALAARAWRSRPFHTLLIDLSLSEAALWEGLEKRTCRYQLRRAEKLAPELWHQRGHDQARALFAGFIARKRFRSAIGDREWRRLCDGAELFVAAHRGQAIAAHLVLVDGARRARALISATVDRADPEGRALAGSLNRWLHWQEIRALRGRGVGEYDFGGLFLDPNHPDRAIDEFKLMFGGAVVTEHVVRLCRPAALRAALRVARGALRRRAAPVPAAEAAP